MLYPRAGDGFAYTDKLLEKQYFIDAAPEKNPLRETVWSDVYMDEAGKGPMVTISSPVYRGDEFLGVVCLDYTTSTLGLLIKDGYASYLMDGKGTIIASGREENYGKEVKTLNAQLGVTERHAEKIMGLSGGEIERLGNRYYYAQKLEPSPWVLVMSASVLSMVSKEPLI
jgi:sigma-B regulation protein RsbU (phosphoserine phosphatase)